jgi:tRNA-specific adenosine deaminase 3
VKTIRKTTGDVGGELELSEPVYTNGKAETVYQMIVGTGLDPPVDLPKHYPSPIQCQIPATAATQRAYLEAKNLIWPTVYSPHLIPKPLEHTAADIELIYFAMTLLVIQAQSAAAAGDVCALRTLERDKSHIPQLPIAACVLQDQFLRSAVVVSDTRNSSKHPLHHAVLNLIREVASSTTSHPHPQVQETDTVPVSGISSKVYRVKPTSALESPSFHSTPDPIHPAVAPIQDHLHNGEGYQLTNRTLYITHEPCIMCTMALVHARVKEVVFIHSMPTTGGCGGTVLVPELKTINHRFNVWRWKDRQAVWSDALTVREIDV